MRARGGRSSECWIRGNMFGSGDWRFAIGGANCQPAPARRNAEVEALEWRCLMSAGLMQSLVAGGAVRVDAGVRSAAAAAPGITGTYSGSVRLRGESVRRTAAVTVSGET